MHDIYRNCYDVNVNIKVPSNEHITSIDNPYKYPYVVFTEVLSPTAVVGEVAHHLPHVLIEPIYNIEDKISIHENSNSCLIEIIQKTNIILE